MASLSGSPLVPAEALATPLYTPLLGDLLSCFVNLCVWELLPTVYLIFRRSSEAGLPFVGRVAQ